MLFHKTVFALALAGAVLPAAFANSGSTWVGGERGFEFHAQKSTKSRAEVQKELETYRKSPMTADGGTWEGRDARYTSPQHSYAFQGGKLVHTDTIAHDTPRPTNLAMTDAERALYRGH